MLTFNYCPRHGVHDFHECIECQKINMTHPMDAYIYLLADLECNWKDWKDKNLDAD